MRRINAVFAALIGCSCFSNMASAITVSYSDGTFLESDWSSTKFFDTTIGQNASFKVSQATSNGDPGYWRATQLDFHYNGNDHISQGVWVGEVRAGAIYDPREYGALTSFQFGWDAIITARKGDGPSVNMGALLVQDGIYYFYNVPFLWYKWRHVGGTLTSTDFRNISGAGPAHPDFTDTGDPMQFGYITASAIQNGGPINQVIYAGIDNFLVRVTSSLLPGDANKNGRIDPDDYGLIDRGYLRQLATPGWSDGDFNLDGVVDYKDYAIIDASYALQGGFAPSTFASHESEFGSDYAASFMSLVPEPSAPCIHVRAVVRRQPRRPPDRRLRRRRHGRPTLEGPDNAGTGPRRRALDRRGGTIRDQDDE